MTDRIDGNGKLSPIRRIAQTPGRRARAVSLACGCAAGLAVAIVLGMFPARPQIAAAGQCELPSPPAIERSGDSEARIISEHDVEKLVAEQPDSTRRADLERCVRLAQQSKSDNLAVHAIEQCLDWVLNSKPAAKPRAHVESDIPPVEQM